jgi:tryptophan-rich sensory protein
MRSVRRTTVLAEPGYRAVQLVWLLLTVAEAFVALRVIFRAVSANPAAGFVRFVDTVAGVLVAPFHPIVADARLGGGGVLEIGSLVAMAVFLAAALVLVRLIRILTAPRPPAEPAPV